MRIVLAYSGSLEGSAAIPWLRERHGAEVVAVTLDLGQGRELEAIRDAALALGAHRAHVLDVRDVFAQDVLVPAIRASAMHGGRAPLAMALSRPVIAHHLVDIARIERASAVAHTSRLTGGESHVARHLDVTAGDLRVVAPALEWTFDRTELAAYARSHGLGSIPDDPSRVEWNLWGRTWTEAHAGVPPVPKPPSQCPDEPAHVEVTFTRGEPTALNGVGLPLVELVGSLAALASTHGVGYVREGAMICDAPAAVVLHAAHRAVRTACSTSDVERFSDTATVEYVRLVEHAGWYSPLREALDAYFAAAQSTVTGRVRVRLFKGEASTLAVELPRGAVPGQVTRLSS